MPSGSVFRIEYGASPLDDYSYRSTVAGEQRSSGLGWQDVTQAVRQWAVIVKRECVDLDLCAELRRGREFFTGTQAEDFANTSFTPGEQAEIAEQFQKIKEYVKKTYSLSIEQAARVEIRFDEAEDASHRMGRKDWLLMFGGALFSLILSAVVPPEAVQHILSRLLKAWVTCSAAQAHRGSRVKLSLVTSRPAEQMGSPAHAGFARASRSGRAGELTSLPCGAPGWGDALAVPAASCGNGARRMRRSPKLAGIRARLQDPLGAPNTPQS